MTVPCAIEFEEGAVRSERFGQARLSRIEVVLLAPDYEQVKDFQYVVWGGDKYIRSHGQVYALGSVDVWLIGCIAEDES